MDTSPTPCISPLLEPETATALMLRYVEDNEEAAHQYARALMRFFMLDLDPRESFHLVHNIITEATNDIREFEGEDTASRIDIALRRLVNRVKAELTELAD